LASRDLSGKSDPYLVFTIKTDDKNKVQKQQTKVINQNLNPTWKELVWFEVNPDSVIKVECWDEDKVSRDDTMGTFEFHVRHILERQTKDEWYLLAGKNVILQARDKTKPHHKLRE